MGATEKSPEGRELEKRGARTPTKENWDRLTLMWYHSNTKKKSRKRNGRRRKKTNPKDCFVDQEKSLYRVVPTRGGRHPRWWLPHQGTFRATFAPFQQNHYGTCRSCPEVFLSIPFIFRHKLHGPNLSILKRVLLNWACSGVNALIHNAHDVFLNWARSAMGPPCMDLNKSPCFLCLRTAWLWMLHQNSPCLWLVRNRPPFFRASVVWDINTSPSVT